MKSSVIIFPGSNCDRDMSIALEKFGFKKEDAITFKIGEIKSVKKLLG